MKIIKEREHKIKIDYTRCFEWKDSPGAGFSFPVDENGNFTNPYDSPQAVKNFEMCINDTDKLIDRGIVKHETSYTEPAIGICDNCGSEVELYSFTNECECGCLYNMFGQALRPQEEWGWCGDDEEEYY